MKSEKCFIVGNLDNKTNRIDAHFFNPIYLEAIKEMENYSKKKKQINLLPLKKLLKKSKTNLTGGGTPKGTPYVTEDEGVKFIRVQNIRRYKINLEDVVYIPHAYHSGMLKRSQIKPSDVLLTITGTYGFSVIAPEDFGEANMSQHSAKIEVNEDIIAPKYLCCFLNSVLAKLQMDRLVTGGTRPALDYPSIKSINILFPKSKDCQINISEETMKIVDRAYERFYKKEEILSNMNKEIISSLGIKLPSKSSEKWFIADILNNDRIDAIFYSPYNKKFLELLKDFSYRPLRKLVRPLNKIKTPIQEFYSLIDLRNVEECTGRYKIKEVRDIVSDKILLQYEKIFVSHLNPTKGKSFLVDEKLNGCVVSNEFVPLEIISDEVIPKYLIAILRSKIALTQWKYAVTGSTPSRERIGKRELLSTIIPLPNEDTQIEIANKIYKDIEEVSKLEQEFNNYIKMADDTFLNELIALT